MLPDQDAEAFRVTVTDANTGGLLATVGSLPAFLPFSLMLKDAGSDWLSPDVSACPPCQDPRPRHMMQRGAQTRGKIVPVILTIMGIFHLQTHAGRC